MCRARGHVMENPISKQKVWTGNKFQILEEVYVQTSKQVGSMFAIIAKENKYNSAQVCEQSACLWK